MLTIVKTALRLSPSVEAFDEELQLLIDDCLAELAMLGIISAGTTETDDPQIKTAVIAYCKWRFGDNPDAERWEHIYHDKVGKLQMASGYGLGDDQCTQLTR